MTLEAVLPHYIDSTMLSAFRSCPRKHYQEFILGLRPPGRSPDLHAGGCFASALEEIAKAHYTDGLDIPSSMQRGFGKFTLEWGDYTPPPSNPKTFDKMWDAVGDYYEKWPLDTDHVQPYYVEGIPTFETTFAIPLEPTALHDVRRSDETWAYTSYDPRDHVVRDIRLFPLHPSGDPFLYTGRFDMLGAIKNRPVVRDEKTSKYLKADWSEQWNLRSQFIGYTWACKQMGLDLDTVVIRGVIITKTQPTRLVEAIKQYTDVIRERWYDQLWRDLWRLRRAWDEGHWDYNLGESCTAYGACMFSTACASDRPDRWWNQFEVNRWNPLNKDAA